MTQEEKQLLLNDLCGRLTYGVKVDVSIVEEWKELTLTPFILSNYYDDIEKIKPYLRPLSSMTEEEENSLLKFGAVTHLSNDEVIDVACVGFEHHAKVQDWLNAHHFDYRRLIPMGLALEAPEDMYKTE